ncbi:dipeptide ABC transporter ATP-binding protein [Tardiphaga sp. 215_C5_N2_1]|uniref:dipeptide ABC transporter ATP-binding protein n=1 Tax=Tardiphaga sp. 215_C5_N2_1 TaxID=3240774 RepID=UPI003F895CA4
MNEFLLRVSNLEVEFATRHGVVSAVRGVSMGLNPGGTLGIVGESGSGKSVTAYAITRLLDRAGKVTAGKIEFGGRDLLSLSEADMRRLRGPAVSMIFQNARAALNPIRTVGQQLTDALAAHTALSKSQQQERSLGLLRDVMLSDVGRILRSYPHELSGGMCQRVMIALAIACNPKLLIADEATTGLDVTTQKVVMDLLAKIAAERGMGVILITHDLGLAARYCNDICVMQQGKVVEAASVEEVFLNPQHPYTRKLVAASPTATSTINQLVGEDGSPPVENVVRLPKLPLGTPPLLELLRVQKVYDEFKAVDGVSFQLRQGESIGLVGESGSGKSTISRLVTRLIDKTDGTINFNGVNIGDISSARFNSHPLRREIQIVFQDPHESLNPRYSAFDCIAHPLRTLRIDDRKGQLKQRVEECAERVGLPHELLSRFPHQLSGGQKARVGIARAIATRPKLLVLDEPTAALDVSVQAVVLKLLDTLRREEGLAFLFVSHDLNVVRMLCERIIVLKAGAVVEEESADKIFTSASSEYTRELLAAIPSFVAGPIRKEMQFS